MDYHFQQDLPPSCQVCRGLHWSLLVQSIPFSTETLPSPTAGTSGWIGRRLGSIATKWRLLSFPLMELFSGANLRWPAIWEGGCKSMTSPTVHQCLLPDYPGRTI